MKDIESLNEHLRRSEIYESVEILRVVYELMIEGKEVKVEIWEDLTGGICRYYAIAKVYEKEPGKPAKLIEEKTGNSAETIEEAFYNLEQKLYSLKNAEG
jgi:hypothetical protein